MKRKALILIVLCSLGFWAWEAQAVCLETSPSNHNSRLFGVMGDWDYEIPKMDMCYYLDSYLGLGYQYLLDNPLNQYADECPAAWFVNSGQDVFNHDYSSTYYHILKVIYCYSHAHGFGTD